MKITKTIQPNACGLHSSKQELKENIHIDVR